MLKRQKVILDILGQSPCPLEKVVLVKLAFLCQQETNDFPFAFYDFLPFKKGPYSFTLEKELDNLAQAGHVTVERGVVAIKSTQNEAGDHWGLPPRVRNSVASIISHYSEMTTEELLSDIYSRYPRYASRSEISIELGITPMPPPVSSPAVFTKGYEGESVDYFFDELLAKGIMAVIDVRNNPVSRKHGFSKTAMKGLSEQLGIRYLHFPNLGILSKDRKNLATQDDYDRLFRRYKHRIQQESQADLKAVCNLMATTSSVLLCFEEDINFCHRKPLAESVAKMSEMPIYHI